MSVYKKNDIWYIDYYHNGKRVRESVGPGRQRDAEAALAKRKVQIKENRMFDANTVCDLIFSRMMNDFLAYAKIHRKSYRGFCVKSKPLIAAFGEKLIRDITPSDIEGYKKARAEIVAVSTVNRELAILKAAYNRLIRDGVFNGPNPASKIALFSEQHLARDRVLTSEKYQRLISAMHPTLVPIAETALHTGMRLGEILNLRWDQVDFKGGFINLAPEDTKSAYARSVPLNNRVTSLLHSLIRRLDTPFVFHFKGKRRTSIQTAWRAACRRAGIADFHFHDLRHMAVTRMVNAGIPETAIMAISGHRTRSVFKRYVNLTPADLKRLVQTMDTSMDTERDAKLSRHEKA